jgi:hypothetical protein
MPVSFPIRDTETGALVDVEFFTLPEVADRLHMSLTTVKEYLRADKWPYLRVGRSRFMSAEDIARAVESGRHDPDRIPEATGRPALGIPISDTDLEGLR